ncbi:hypothetical protein HF086_017265 [Spodoptera exigua]|uniref:Uncharacterized protein n=1 Tax=Spodoptera exigua TaxID=7107 RepID=A0A922S7W8_SPOEX|nr:hypothetical protein HF086_017265 [Spodoptera exigua]
MSTKTSRKVATRAKVEPVITRTKSAQQRRQQKNKEKKTEKPESNKDKDEIKSTKVKTDKSPKEALSEPIKIPDDVIEQVEYYPDKLKRDVAAKKIRLKPKHNFTVIASTNKRKMATPQKGLKSPPPLPTPSPTQQKFLNKKLPQSSSPQPSVQEMVRMMEESRSLSDEDFMEILTCPSPVWWEDPPDGDYSEDAIIMVSPEPPAEKTSKSKKRKIFINPTTDTANKIEQFKTANKKKDEKFAKKKLKLENVLGNIKNKNLKQNGDLAKQGTVDEAVMKFSESEGEISDLSFNEEEILKNLENMDIPIETIVKTEPKTESVVKQEFFLDCDSEIVQKTDKIGDTTSPVDIKPIIKEEYAMNSDITIDKKIAVLNSQCNISVGDINTNSDEISNLNSVHVKCNTDFTLTNSNKSKTAGLIIKKTNTNKVITVRKIRPEQFINDSVLGNELKSAENSKNIVVDSVRGKLDDFFKQCKSSKRLKKGDSPIPAISMTDVKEEITDNEANEIGTTTEVVGEENRLKSCDCDSLKTENGTGTGSSCEKCEKAVILPCDSCNFLVIIMKFIKNIFRLAKM